MKNCFSKLFHSPTNAGERFTPREVSCFQKFLSLLKMSGDANYLSKLLRIHKNAYISKTVLDGANSTKFLTCWISLQSTHANFQNIFVSPNIAAILNFLQKLQKHKIAEYLGKPC